MKVIKQKPKQEAPKKFYYTQIPEFEEEGIPYITYGQSMAFNKLSAIFFQDKKYKTFLYLMFIDVSITFRKTIQKKYKKGENETYGN